MANQNVINLLDAGVESNILGLTDAPAIDPMGLVNINRGSGKDYVQSNVNMYGNTLPDYLRQQAPMRGSEAYVPIGQTSTFKGLLGPLQAQRGLLDKLFASGVMSAPEDYSSPVDVGQIPGHRMSSDTYGYQGGLKALLPSTPLGQAGYFVNQLGNISNPQPDTYTDDQWNLMQESKEANRSKLYGTGRLGDRGNIPEATGNMYDQSRGFFPRINPFARENWSDVNLYPEEPWQEQNYNLDSWGIDRVPIEQRLQETGDSLKSFITQPDLSFDLSGIDSGDYDNQFNVTDRAVASLYPSGYTEGSTSTEPINEPTWFPASTSSGVISGEDPTPTDWRSILGIDPNPGFTAREILGIREPNQRVPARRFNRDEFGNVESLARFTEPSIENINTLLLNTLVPQEGITAAVSRPTSPVSTPTKEKIKTKETKPKDDSNARQAREAEAKARLKQSSIQESTVSKVIEVFEKEKEKAADKVTTIKQQQKDHRKEINKAKASGSVTAEASGKFKAKTLHNELKAAEASKKALGQNSMSNFLQAMQTRQDELNERERDRQMRETRARNYGDAFDPSGRR